MNNAMSEKNRDGKRSARQRMREERAEQEARARRNKRLMVLASVLAVVGVVVAVGIVVQNERSTPETPVSAPAGSIGPARLVIPDGPADAPSALTVYEDPRCPACGSFEAGFHKTINTL